MTVSGSVSLADLVQAFFRRHLIATRDVSPHTVHAYRDAIRSLLTFAAARSARSVVKLSVDNLGRDTVLAFLEHLERQRGNAAATRNARLAAIHSLHRFIAVEDPTALAVCQQVLSIPYKRTSSRAVTCLARADIEHLLISIDRSTALGRRDVALLQFLYNTGARAQEVVDLRLSALRFDAPAKCDCWARVGRSGCVRFGWRQSISCVRCLGIARPGSPKTSPLCQCDRTPTDAFWLGAHSANASGGSVNLSTDAGQSADYTAHLPPHDCLAPAAIGSGT